MGRIATLVAAVAAALAALAGLAYCLTLLDPQGFVIVSAAAGITLVQLAQSVTFWLVLRRHSIEKKQLLDSNTDLTGYIVALQNPAAASYYDAMKDARQAKADEERARREDLDERLRVVPTFGQALEDTDDIEEQIG